MVAVNDIPEDAAIMRELKAILDAIQTGDTDLKTALENLDGTVTSIEANTKNIETSSDHMSSTLDGIATDTGVLKTDLADVLTAVKSIDGNTEPLASKLDAIDSSVKDSTREITKVDKSVKKVDKSVNKVDKSVKKVDKSVKAVSISVDAVTAAIGALAEALADALVAGAAGAAAAWEVIQQYIDRKVREINDTTSEVGANVDAVHTLFKGVVNFTDGDTGPLGVRSVGYVEDPRGPAYDPIPMESEPTVKVADIAVPSSGLPVQVKTWSAGPLSVTANASNPVYIQQSAGSVWATRISDSQLPLPVELSSTPSNTPHVIVDSVTLPVATTVLNVVPIIIKGTEVYLSGTALANSDEIHYANTGDPLLPGFWNELTQTLAYGVDKRFIIRLAGGGVAAINTEEHNGLSSMMVRTAPQQ